MLSGAGVMLGARTVMAVFGWIGLLFVARSLGEVAFGSYAFVFALLGMLGIVADFETTRIVMAEVDDWPNLDELVGRFIVFRVLLSSVMYGVALAVVVAGSYTGTEVKAVALGGSSYFLASALWSLITVCQAKFWLRSVAIAMIVGQAIQLALVIVVFASDEHSVLRYVFPAVVNDAVALAVLVFLLRRVIRIRPRVDVATWRRWFFSALPLATGSIIGQIYFKLDGVMLTWLLPRREGRTATGLYQIGYKFSDLLAFVVPALLAAVLPVLARARTREAFREGFASALIIVSVVVGLAVPVFLVLARPAINFFFGQGLAPAATPARWLIVGQAINFLTQLAFIALVAANRRRSYPKAALVGLVFNVVLNVILIPDYGVMGAAIATIFTEVVVLAILMTSLRGLALRPFPLAVLFRVGAAASLSGGAAAVGVRIFPWIIAGIVSVAVFVAVLEVVGIDGPSGWRGFAERQRQLRTDSI